MYYYLQLPRLVFSLLFFSVFYPNLIFATTMSGLGWMDCKTSLHEISPDHHSIRRMNYSFDIGEIDNTVMVKLFDNILDESIALYPATLDYQDSHYTLLFKIIDAAENTRQFKLIYSVEGGASEFYTQVEQDRWINMLDDTMIKNGKTRVYKGNCRMTLD